MYFFKIDKPAGNNKLAMTIIGLFYLLLIVGWILLILVLKCKRARAKRIAEEAAVAAAAAAQQCHVIQIGSNYYDIIPSNHGFSSSSCHRSCSSNLHLDDSHSNPAFIIDEPGVFPTNGSLPDLPPSYEDVMRLPSSYPKVAPRTAPDTVPQYQEGPAVIDVTTDHLDTNNNQPVRAIASVCSCGNNNHLPRRASDTT